MDGLIELEEDLGADVERNPGLTVKLVARDTVPFSHVLHIREAIRQYQVPCSLEVVSSGFEGNEKM